ncbi:hypothetical protein GT347_20290 [Xylophilus rhododendri]|uniref:Putative DnaT-like domain-containing protein n=1 Tax=Xylophilus rhododendri TaxID=2697032 RepID=A0A857JAE7_9BURK|nr:DnaT-like ssDNA-binding protein [Xylophilus rhododendri]QHJ00112.1 hypothetical protein GT347_20290 [Xylophilus rhododendri]
MPLTVDTGAGNPAADSFVSLADATAYHSSIGNTAWADLAPDVQEQRLRRATAFMEQAYRMRWAGTRVTSTQALSWPRAWVPMPDAPGGYGSLPAYYPIDSVPVAVQRACAELALKAATSSSLAPDVKPLATRVKVGPIEKEYAAGSRQTTRYGAVEGMLAPFFATSGGMVRVVRA